jgi:hypothetical protein
VYPRSLEGYRQENGCRICRDRGRGNPIARNRDRLCTGLSAASSGSPRYHPRQTNGFIEAINGLFQAAKRRARGYTRFTTMRTVLFLIAGKLDFSSFNPHAS